MTTICKNFILLIVSSVFFLSCERTQRTADGNRQVKVVIDDFSRFWETGDTVLFSSLFEHDEHMISFGSDSNETFVGYTAFHDSVMKVLPHFKNLKVVVKDQAIHLGPSEDVAWFSEVMDWTLLFDNRPTRLPNQRFTGVLVKKDDQWKFVQFHVSVPVSPQ